MDWDFCTKVLSGDPSMTVKIRSLQKEIFDVVYEWGRASVVVDCDAPHYQKLLVELKEEIINEK